MERNNRKPGRISRPARYPHTASVLIIMFGCIAGGLAQQASENSPKLKEPNPALLSGQHLFEARCASCHGLNGKGGERAPDLVTRPEIARLSERELLDVLRKGVPSKGMPAFGGMPPGELSSVVKFVRSMQGNRNLKFAPASIENGKKLFNGKGRCADCHMVHGVGGFLGSDLSIYAANHSAEDIRGAILAAGKRPGIRKGLANITTSDGRTISGLVRNEDNFSIQVQSVDGAFHLLEKSALSELTFEPAPLMPNDYSSQLSQSELEELVAYLASTVDAK
jgi:putative heme-binding domain-containing protein